MERKQTSVQPVNEKIRREQITDAKQRFRIEQRNLSFNEKMKIAFALNERDKQLKKAWKK